MRDARRIQERVEVRLDRTQVLWLTLGGVVAMGLMFAFGFVLGQRAARIAEDPSASPIASVDAQSEAVVAMATDDLTFYDELKEPEPPAPVPAPAARAPVHEPRSKPKPAEQPGNLDSAVARARETARDMEASRPESQGTTLRAALDAGPAEHGEFTVQVSAFQSRAEADAYAAGLTRKGYNPFVVESSIAGRGVWYRVRLGRFDTEQKAERAKQMLASADIPAWVLKAE